MTAVDPTTPTNTPTTARSRRDVLCGLVVALVAPGALAVACSDGGSSTGATTGDSTPAGGTPAGGTPAGGGSGKGVAALADVPDGGGLVVDNPGGGKLLLARTGDEVTAYNAACTHMGTIVGAPKDGVAVCPSHGSEFDTATGAARKGPATKPLLTVAVKVDGDRIVLA